MPEPRQYDSVGDIIDDLLNWKEAAKECAADKDHLILWHQEEVAK